MKMRGFNVSTGFNTALKYHFNNLFSHTSVAPDCSLAETKWFFTSNIDSITLHYTVSDDSNDMSSL